MLFKLFELLAVFLLGEQGVKKDFGYKNFKGVAKNCYEPTECFDLLEKLWTNGKK